MAYSSTHCSRCGSTEHECLIVNGTLHRHVCVCGHVDEWHKREILIAPAGVDYCPQDFYPGGLGP